VIAIPTLRRGLGIAIAVVAMLGLIVELWHLRAHTDLVETLVEMLSLSYEANLPTWFSSSLLLGCALAAGAVAVDHPAGARWRFHWWALALGFGYASLDEAVEIHEHLGGTFETTGVLYYDWVIPAAVIVAVLAALFLPFIRALPQVTRRALLIAAVVYLGGALGMELPLGWWTEHAGKNNIGYALIDWVEEILEMIGASLAVVALVEHRRTVGDTGEPR
jgi:hypothetical protein